MFKKLVSNLPFHPGMLGQVSFYVYRLRQETSLRRAGLLFVSLTLIVQMFAIIVPSKPSLATSASDIIYGATSKQDVVSAYRNNRDPYGRTDIKAIFNYYGIGLEQLNNSKSAVIKSGDNRNYINTSRSTTSFPDTFVNIPGAVDGGIYEFPLQYWDTSQFPNGYPAITGTSKYGFKFWILLKGCGNIVIEKGSKKPELVIHKERTSSATVNPGDTVTYQIQFRNKGLAIADNVTITDNLAKEFDYIEYKSGIDLRFNKNGDILTWRIDNKGSTLAPSDRWHTITLKLKAKKIERQKQQACNASRLDASNAGAVVSEDGQSKRCVTIETPTCPGTGAPIPPGGIDNCTVQCPDGSVLPYTKDCPDPVMACKNLEIIGAPSWNTRKLQTTIIKQPSAQVKQINYYVNDKKVSSVAWSGGTVQNYSHTFAAPGTYTIRAELVARVGVVQPNQKCILSETIEQPSTPTPKLSTDKAVSNLTQKIGDANNTTAKAGDVLRYTIIIANSGDGQATLKLEGEYGESIADILEYANLTDKGDAVFNERTKFLSWGQVTIKPGEKVEKTFTVTIKNPIPATPTSTSNPLSYDYVLHNKYGRDVNVKLNKPASKVIEQTATKLPNTGPGTTMIISVLATIIISYFFYRSRLLSKELEFIHHEYSAGGV